MNAAANFQQVSHTPGVAHKAPAGSNLREVLTIVFRDRWRIAAAFLVGLLLTVLAAVMVPKKYVAEASLLLRLGREYVYTPEVGDNGGAPITYDREQTLVSEARIIASRDLREAVIDKLGIEAIYPEIAASLSDPAKRRTAALLAMEKALDAEMLKGSNLLQVKFTHPDPALSAKLLSELIDAYLKKRATVFANATYGTAEADFVARTIQLHAAETKLAAIKKDRGIRAFGEEQSLLLAQRNTLDQRVTDNTLALAQASGRAVSLVRSLGGLQFDVTLSSETQRSEALENARKVLLDLQLKERDLSSRFVDNHPSVQDVRADIERTQVFVREQDARPTRTVRTGRSPSRDVVESDLLRAQADQNQARAGVKALSTQRAAIDTRLAAFAESETELQRLERDRRFAEANYEASAKRLRDEIALEELDRRRRSNVSMVQSPMVPLEPKSLRPVVLLVGVFLSLCAALLAAFLSALWRDTFITAEQAERSLGLPMLAVMPLART